MLLLTWNACSNEFIFLIWLILFSVEYSVLQVWTIWKFWFAPCYIYSRFIYHSCSYISRQTRFYRMDNNGGEAFHLQGNSCQPRQRFCRAWEQLTTQEVETCNRGIGDNVVVDGQNCFWVLYVETISKTLCSRCFRGSFIRCKNHQGYRRFSNFAWFPLMSQAFPSKVHQYSSKVLYKQCSEIIQLFTFTWSTLLAHGWSFQHELPISTREPIGMNFIWY